MVKRDENNHNVGGSQRPEVKRALQSQYKTRNSAQRRPNATDWRKKKQMMKISKNVAILCGLPFVFHDDDWR